MLRQSAFLLLLLPALLAAEPLRFELSFDAKVHAKPVTGRVYVMLVARKTNTPFSGLNWFRPEPVFAKDVKDWKPGEPLLIDDKALAFPTPLKDLKQAGYTVQAVMDLNLGGSEFSLADGNLYSMPLWLELDPASSGTQPLKIDQVWKGVPYKGSERVKIVDIESKLLTAFHGKPIRMKAGVALPKSFETDKERKYPVVYSIPGFSGTYRNARSYEKNDPTNVAGTEVLHVLLDPECPLGHHVFADSANNGPWGKALIEELIPAIEKQYRGIGTPASRVVTGHSSGGWSSLWLMVTYPDFFGGVWSTAPDPVDFRDFQRIDIYKGDNVFTEADGKPRPLARRNGQAALFYKNFSDMEEIMGHGGQLGSFEAVFSPKGSDGKPRKLWDRKTGKIDPETAKAWEKYDINLVLERNWETLGPKLAGKLHVYMGDEDTFYLEGATRLVGQTLRKLGSDAKVELFPGKDHSNLMDRSLRERVAKEMAETFKKMR